MWFHLFCAELLVKAKKQFSIIFGWFLCRNARMEIVETPRLRDFVGSSTIGPHETLLVH